MTLVLVHELGHFLFAKLFKVKVEVFAIGFGKTLYSFKDKANTEWRINLLPLGGYVKMLGFNESDKIDDKSAFQNKKTWQKFLIVLGGPLANYILSAILFFIIFAALTEPPRISEVTSVIPHSVADHAGILAKDKIIKLDDSEIKTALHAIHYINSSTKQSITFTIQRNNELITLPITLPEKGTLIGLMFESNERIQSSMLDKAMDSVKTCYLITINISSAIISMLSKNNNSAQLSGIFGIMKSTAEATNGGFAQMLKHAAILSLNLGFFNLLPIPALDGGYLFHYIAQIFTGGRTLPVRIREIILRIGIAILICLMLFATWNDILSLIS